jgi:hypothetical protein
MFVRRCAWHRRYHGHPKVLGVSSWGGWGLTFSDGMCADCAARARAEWNLPPAPGRPIAAPARRYALRPEFALASIVLIAAMGVIYGVVLGPPNPTMVYAPTPPARSVVASRDEAPLRSDATLTFPSSRLISEPAVAGVVPSRTPAGAMETPVAPRATVFERAAPPIRVTRAAGKRPRIVTPRSASFVIPVATEDAPEPALEAPTASGPQADQPWVTALARVPVQAP